MLRYKSGSLTCYLFSFSYMYVRLLLGTSLWRKAGRGEGECLFVGSGVIGRDVPDHNRI